MPAYLCHGFRWHRPSIRVFVIVQNLDDASPDWIARPATLQSLLGAFYNLFDFLPEPELGPEEGGDGQRRRQKSGKARAKADDDDDDADVPGVVRRGDGRDEALAAQDWSAVKLLEEYDPFRLDEVSRPHAYVADYVARVDLSASVGDEMARYERLLRRAQEVRPKDGGNPAMTGPLSDEGSLKTAKKKAGTNGWLERLRDQLQRGEAIRWYVVVNGDEERAAPWPDEPPGRQGRQTQQQQQRAFAEEDEEEDERQYRQQQQQRLQEQASLQQQQQQQQQQQRQWQTAQQPSSSSQQQPQSALDSFLDRGFGSSTVDDDARERERRRLRYELTGDADILWEEDQRRGAGGGGGNSSSPRGFGQTQADTTGGGRRRGQSQSEQRQTPSSLSASSTSTRRASQSAAAAAAASKTTTPRMTASDYDFLQGPPPPPQPQTLFSEPPTLRPRKSVDAQGLRPKTPNGRSGGGLRRLFGRSSKGEEAS